jgi:hypothetical protein
MLGGQRTQRKKKRKKKGGTLGRPSPKMQGMRPVALALARRGLAYARAVAPKIVKADADLEIPMVVRALEERYGARFVHLPPNVPEERLCHEMQDADLLLTCYADISRPVISAAARLRGIVKVSKPAPLISSAESSWPCPSLALGLMPLMCRRPRTIGCPW